MKNEKNLSVEEMDDMEYRLITTIKANTGSKIRTLNKLAQSNYKGIDYQLMAQRYYEILELAGF